MAENDHKPNLPNISNVNCDNASNDFLLHLTPRRKRPQSETEVSSD